jgi:hypothetical protein
VDGAFWHGHPDYYRNQSGDFWNRKIAKNRERDRKVNDERLEPGGWRHARSGGDPVRVVVAEDGWLRLAVITFILGSFGAQRES